MTNEQIERAFYAALGYPPRAADLQTIDLLGRDPDTVADFIWDHHMGEPEHPSLEMVESMCREA
jgi:hypothetical protein